MIKVGKILAYIRKDKGFTQGALIKYVKDYCSEGQVRDIEAGRTAYIKPVLLLAFMEFLELNEIECEFLVQENVRCLLRDELKDISGLKNRKQLVAAIADLATMLVRARTIDTTTVAAEINKHTLPYLYKRPAYIDSILTSISKDQA